MYYVAEIQDVSDTVTRQRRSPGILASMLAVWTGRAGRSVAVYRVEGEVWTLVDRRTTRAHGTAPAGYQAGVQRDAAWDAAVA